MSDVDIDTTEKVNVTAGVDNAFLDENRESMSNIQSLQMDTEGQRFDSNIQANLVGLSDTIQKMMHMEVVETMHYGDDVLASGKQSMGE